MNIGYYFIRYLLWICIVFNSAFAIDAEHNITSLNMYEVATNRNFKVIMDNKPIYLRIGRDNPGEVGINRMDEMLHYKVAEQLGIAPFLIAYHLDHGILITEFIEGSSPSEEEIHDFTLLANIVSQIKSLHEYSYSDSPLPKKTVFQINDRLLVVRPKSVDESDIDKWLMIRKSFEERYYEGISVGLCHGDLFRGNLLNTNNGRLYLIDWEYSFFGHVIDDLGKLCSANWLSDEEMLHVVSEYWGTEDLLKVRKLEQNIFMQQFNFYLWCHIQAVHNADDSSAFLLLAERVKVHLFKLSCDLSPLSQVKN
jgi:thiamine kinase-like enzyme